MEEFYQDTVILITATPKVHLSKTKMGGSRVTPAPTAMFGFAAKILSRHCEQSVAPNRVCSPDDLDCSRNEIKSRGRCE